MSEQCVRPTATHTAAGEAWGGPSPLGTFPTSDEVVGHLSPLIHLPGGRGRDGRRRRRLLLTGPHLTGPHWTGPHHVAVVIHPAVVPVIATVEVAARADE